MFDTKRVVKNIIGMDRTSRNEGKYVCVDRILILANGKEVKGKVCGYISGDVWEIKIKQGSKYINAKKVKGNIYPIISKTKTPFKDMSYKNK